MGRPLEKPTTIDKRVMTTILRRCLRELSDAYLIPHGCHGSEAADVINEALIKAWTCGRRNGGAGL